MIDFSGRLPVHTFKFPPAVYINGRGAATKKRQAAHIGLEWRKKGVERSREQEVFWQFLQVYVDSGEPQGAKLQGLLMNLTM